MNTWKLALFVIVCVLTGGLFYIIHRRYKFDFFYDPCPLAVATHVQVKVKADFNQNVHESSGGVGYLA